MKRHDWAIWKKGIERCVRRGCKALIDRAGHRRRYSIDGGKTWTSARPACMGEPTTDKPKGEA